MRGYVVEKRHGKRAAGRFAILREFRPATISITALAVNIGGLVGAPFENHEMLRILHRQRSHQDAVNQTENRRVRADAQRQRENGHDGETRRFEEHSRAIAQVLNQRPHTASCPYAKDYAGAIVSQETPIAPLLPRVSRGWSPNSAGVVESMPSALAMETLDENTVGRNDGRGEEP